jgi:hypothetical protein
MDRSIPLFLIGLVLGGGIGFTIAAGNGFTLDGHDHSDPAAHENGEAGHAHDPAQTAQHDHDTPLVLPDSATAPDVRISVLPDPVAGWNVHIVARNFRFAPDHASTDHVEGEGHAHLYINGAKFARVYGDWIHIPTLPSGGNEIRVTLNANDHRPLFVGTRAVSAGVIVTAP